MQNSKIMWNKSVIRQNNSNRQNVTKLINSNGKFKKTVNLIEFLHLLYENRIDIKYSRGREKMANLSNTQYFKVKTEPEVQVKEVLDVVYTAMEEKGYNPVNQIVGYIMSGDPTYITSYKGARSMIMKVERDELVEELLKEYIKNRSWENR